MEYNLQNLMQYEIQSSEDYRRIYLDYLDCDAILDMQKNIDLGLGTAKFELTVAHLRMAKEFDLRDRYGIPLHADTPLEWFHASFEHLNNNIEVKQAAFN